MIAVQQLYLDRQDILAKGHAGWISGEEFNRRLSLCQRALLGYHISHRKDERRSQSALIAFYTSRRLVRSAGFYLLPNDLEEQIDVIAYPGAECGGTGAPMSVDVPARDELSFALSSPIRGKGMNCENYAGKLKIYPEAYTGRVDLKYFKSPSEPFRGFTIDNVNFIEVHNPADDVDLEWDEGERNAFLDLLLMYDGITLRENNITAWAATRPQMAQQISEQ